MWAQISQFGLHPVVWDYHVVLLEQGPDGYTIWDSNCTEGAWTPCFRWTNANFPHYDPSVRFRVVEAALFLQEFRSDRRHMRNELGEIESPPPWPEISPGESNLANYSSSKPGTPGVVFDLAGWGEMTNISSQPLTH